MNPGWSSSSKLHVNSLQLLFREWGEVETPEFWLAWEERDDVKVTWIAAFDQTVLSRIKACSV